MKTAEFSGANADMPDLSGRAFLVTGSTRGIGQAIARHLFCQGATVGLHGRSLETTRQLAQEIQASSPEGSQKVIPLAADLANPENARLLVEEFVKSAGQIDGLVNNAGGGKAVAFRGLTLDRWRQTFAVNLEAAVIASQAAYRFMRNARHGVIVNVASLAAHGPGKWMGADYAASKAGLVSLTRSLAFEAARLNIRVNAVSPGMIETDMTTSLPEATRQGLGIAMQRFGRPEEVASAVAFLLSDQSNYMTGQVLHVNGGLHM